MSSSDSSNPFADFKLWYYTPSIVAGVIFAIIFFILTGLHLFRLIKNRTWFCIPFVLGALFEAIGYSARAGAHSNLKKIMPYVIQSIFILVAPALFAASIYMILGRLMRATKAEHHSIIPVKYLTKIFVAGDILCFMIQSGGGGLMAKASTQSELKNYEYMILGGLILQILIFGVFVAVAAVFHLRLRKMPTTTATTAKYQDPISGLNLPWERYMVMLYAVSVLIALRNVFRVIEYGMGNKGYLLTHEWTLYVFDGVLMAVVLAVCLVWYVPSMKLQKVQSCEVGMVERESYQPK